MPFFAQQTQLHMQIPVRCFNKNTRVKYIQKLQQIPKLTSFNKQ